MKLLKKYPECEKLASVSKESNLCGNFLEWLQTKYFMIDKTEKHDNLYVQLGYSSYINIQYVLGEYFDINMEQVEKEKEQMIKDLIK